MKPQEVKELLEAVQEGRQAGEHCALATVISVQGSAYRREGAKMLISEAGATTCMISGGCLEPEVAGVAKQVLADGTPQRVHYDLDEDVVWGLGLGCGGAVDVLIEPLEQGGLLEQWLEHQAAGKPGVFVTPLGGATGRYFWQPQGVQGELQPSELEPTIGTLARKFMDDPQPRANRHTMQVDGQHVELFVDVSSPPLELVLFGAGHDAVPLAKSARSVGFKVTVVDPRAAFANPEHFPECRIILSHPKDFEERVSLGPKSYSVIMNHHIARDRESLKFLLEKSPPYIGVLGPRSRFHKLVDGLKDEGYQPDPDRLEQVHSPIGLDIGAEGPNEVALSIVAELLAYSRGFPGGFLQGWEGRIHDSART